MTEKRDALGPAPRPPCVEMSGSAVPCGVKAAADKIRMITQIVQRVAELPDRTSPDDWPEAMLVTADELRAILSDALKGGPAPRRPQEPLDVYPAVEDALAKYCRGWMDRPTTRENIAELVEAVCATYDREVQLRQQLQHQLETSARRPQEPDNTLIAENERLRKAVMLAILNIDCERNGLTPDGNVRERLVRVLNEAEAEATARRSPEEAPPVRGADGSGDARSEPKP